MIATGVYFSDGEGERWQFFDGLNICWKQIGEMTEEQVAQIKTYKK